VHDLLCKRLLEVALVGILCVVCFGQSEVRHTVHSAFLVEALGRLISLVQWVVQNNGVNVCTLRVCIKIAGVRFSLWSRIRISCQRRSSSRRRRAGASSRGCRQKSACRGALTIGS
jgi:hypothetical protein